MSQVCFLPVLAQRQGSQPAIPDETVLVIIVWTAWLAVTILQLVGMWIVFKKAGAPGWASIVPIYNVVVLLDISGSPIWWIILFLIPVVNLLIWFAVMLNLAGTFNKGVLFAAGLFFLPFIFFPVLGFSDAEYGGQ